MPIFIATFSKSLVTNRKGLHIVNKMEVGIRTHYSDTEIQDLIEKLSVTDTIRILQVYRILGCSARTDLSENDVFNEVVVKALSLERKWPVNVAKVSFFIETGKSIISNECEKYSKLAVAPTIDELSNNIENSSVPTSATSELSQVSVEANAASSQSNNLISIWIRKIQQLFEEDQQADCFIKQKLDEQKKSRILEVCKFTDQIYRNVEKRVKDKVKKRFPNGFPWWELES